MQNAVSETPAPSTIKAYEKNPRSIVNIHFHHIERHSTWRRPPGNDSTER
jgi:hypothetical protein